MRSLVFIFVLLPVFCQQHELLVLWQDQAVVVFFCRSFQVVCDVVVGFGFYVLQCFFKFVFYFLWQHGGFSFLLWNGRERKKRFFFFLLLNENSIGDFKACQRGAAFGRAVLTGKISYAIKISFRLACYPSMSSISICA